MADNRILTHKHDHVCGHHFSGVAVIIGALVAVGLGFLSYIFSIAVGLTAFPVTEGGKVAFAATGFVWLDILAILTMFFAGWVAGFLGRPFGLKRCLGEIYGFSAWSLALILTVLLTTGTSQFIAQRAYVVDRTNPAIQLTSQLVASVTGQQAKSTGGPRQEAPATEAENLGVITFATFFILFIGALSATFGGRVGIRYRKRDELRSDL